MDVARGALSSPDEGSVASAFGPGPGVGARPPGWAETTWIEDLLVRFKRSCYRSSTLLMLAVGSDLQDLTGSHALLARRLLHRRA